MSYIIGIDIGGTKIHAILIRHARIIERVHLLHAKKTREAVCEVIIRVVETLQRFTKGQRIAGIGVGVPSALDGNEDTLISAPNFPVLKGLHLRSWLARTFKMPVLVDNDARCFVRGAKLPGVRARLVAGLTIGTGLGVGIRDDKRVWEGAHNAAGEIGHTVIVPKGCGCACGQRGCLEMYASRKFLRRMSGREPKPLAELAFSGNRKARKIYKALGYYLGLGIANIVNTVDPEAVVLGGGITNSHWLFLPVAKKVASAHIISPRAKHIPIVPARNIVDAGAMGATMLFAEKTTQNTNYTKHKLR